MCESRCRFTPEKVKESRAGLINTADLLFLFVSGNKGLEVDHSPSERASRCVPYGRGASFCAQQLGMSASSCTPAPLALARFHPLTPRPEQNNLRIKENAKKRNQSHSCGKCRQRPLHASRGQVFAKWYAGCHIQIGVSDLHRRLQPLPEQLFSRLHRRFRDEFLPGSLLLLQISKELLHYLPSEVTAPCVRSRSLSFFCCSGLRIL